MLPNRPEVILVVEWNGTVVGNVWLSGPQEFTGVSRPAPLVEQTADRREYAIQWTNCEGESSSSPSPSGCALERVEGTVLHWILRHTEARSP